MKKHFSARLVVLTTFVSLAALALTPLPASAAGTLATDVVVSAHQNTPASSVKTAAFSTSHDGELLIAFIATDGATAAGSATISAVTGGGLTWTLRKRTNAQYGTAEIWQAVAPTALANATVTATYTGSYTASMTVATFTGADTTTLGAVGGGSAATGAPSASLTTTRAGSWVWGVGDDWSTATARTTGIGQTQVDQLLASSGDTFWTQRQTVPGTVAAPSTVTINDTAPTADRWNLSLIEILPAGTGSTDTTAPTVAMTSPAAGATVSGTVTVSAAASDDVGVASVAFTLDGSPLGAVLTSAPYSLPWDTTSVVGGSHTLVATARDAAGNTGTSAPITVTVSNAADPSVVGSWGPVVPWPEVSIHAALTNTGKILTWMGDFSQGGQQYLLDPTTGNYTQVPDAAVDLFCAGQAVLADGRIAVIGGTATQGGLGIKNVNAFDPVTSTWEPLAPMNYPRWYPTGTTLGDGRVLVTSGSDTTSTDLVQVPEVYNPPTDSWTSLPGATKLIPYYPFMYQLPDGRILQNGASEDPTGTQVLDMSTLQWTTIDSRVLDGASVTSYAPGKFLKAGTASDGGFSGQSAKTAYTLDMNQPNPTWQPTASMAFARSFVNLTTLPDGNVLATGGSTDKSGQNESLAVKPAELWHPSTGTWSTVASLTAPRLYHSVALLLPDGRVFVSGGGGDTGVTNEENYQIYSPPYLFKGARPTITAAPSTVQYNSTAFVKTPDAAGIQSVMLVRTGSITHGFDQNTRSIPLSFTQTTGGLNVQMPVNGNAAPPGYYMLFIVNGAGVPSVAAMTRFPAPYEDTQAPSAPGTLTATSGTGQVGLAWGAATDNVGVAKYDIYRSTTAGFTPAAGNRIAQVAAPATAYTDPGLLAGTYYYRVIAEDAQHNLGPASNEASATVTTSGTYRTITVDKITTVHQSTSSNKIAATGLTTTGSNELLLAFISSDGPSGGGSAAIASVTGGGLTWTLRQRSNAQPGTAEIWQAVAPAPLTNVTVTATQSSGSWQSSMSVVGLLNADTASGASVSVSGASGAPTGALTTTRAGSWVWGVGTDWTAARTHTAGTGQTIIDQYQPPSGDDYWLQRLNAQTPAPGTSVTVNDTAPTTDQWDLALIEVLPAP
ncbi:MAG TPA: galactose oxidase-like domain-containing protein [Diaminobutyricibacter sp.]